jgi:catechol 2,3-dioxygenase-like lactoylglutathione lyase family enzyme
MIKRLDCVSVFTRDIEASAKFYAALGLAESWRIDRTGQGGATVTLIGLKFPDATSSELVLSNNADIPFTEIELLCDDVRSTYADLARRGDIQWIREPFATESGHVAVMEAPDGNVFVLVGA